MTLAPLFPITISQARAIMPTARQADLERFVPHLNILLPPYGIDTHLRFAHFIAQVAHESGALRWVQEIATGEAYEGRKDLGNVQPGDGRRFKGRGLIQLTGRSNYAQFARMLERPDIMAEPSLVATEPDLAVLTACWFWRTRNIDRWADEDDLERVTRAVNGGLNGLADRRDYLVRAKRILGVGP